ncbi:unnamed protein product, partial [Citrullus colocynthis]
TRGEELQPTWTGGGIGLRPVEAESGDVEVYECDRRRLKNGGRKNNGCMQSVVDVNCEEWKTKIVDGTDG